MKNLLVKIILACFLSITIGLAFAQTSNGCGAQSLPDFVPDAPLLVWLPSLGKQDIFRPACDRHDYCYGNSSQSQNACDQQFYRDLLAACDQLNREMAGQWIASTVYGHCQRTAYLYYKAVSEFGAMAKTGTVAGKITNVRHRRIKDWLGDDEFEACVAFQNTGTINAEYRVLLYSSRNTLIDTEPDTYWQDIRTGGVSTICVGTDGIWPSITDLGLNYRVELHAQGKGKMDSRTAAVPR